jgi:hypothetical protein
MLTLTITAIFLTFYPDQPLTAGPEIERIPGRYQPIPESFCKITALTLIQPKIEQPLSR